MKTKFQLTSICFSFKPVSPINNLSEYENVILSYGAIPSQVYTTEYSCYRARNIQHLFYNPFAWTSKVVISNDEKFQQITYEVFYPVPIICLTLLTLGFILYSPIWLSFAAFASLIRYIAIIYFFQRDIVKKMTEVSKINSYFNPLDFK